MILALIVLGLKLFALFVLIPLAMAFAMTACKIARMSNREFRELYGPRESVTEFQKVFGRGRRIRL